MHSMTGFGRGEAIADGIVWRAEASSINRKQLELVVSLPRELSELEIPLRNRCAAKLSRGRVQVSISMDQGSGSGSKLRVDEGVAQQYVESLQNLAQKLHLIQNLSLSEMPRWPGVFSIEQSSWTPEAALPHLEKAVDAAVTQMIAMRKTEGLNLKQDISSRLDALQAMLKEARDISPQIVQRQREMLRQRLEEAGLPLPLDDERLVKEIALFADRIDTTEEQTRAESHIAQFRTYMDSGEPVGRSLDFLSQELFREFNTMGSKANHAQLAQLVVRAKTELEKIREQVQNVE
jgi:uncharacterized protein (TIGR00255 family)